MILAKPHNFIKYSFMYKIYLLFIAIASAFVFYVPKASAFTQCCCRMNASGVAISCVLNQDFATGDTCVSKYSASYVEQGEDVCANLSQQQNAGLNTTSKKAAISQAGCPDEPGKLLVSLPIPGATSESTENPGCFYAEDLLHYLAGLYQWLVAIISILAVVMVMYGGYKYILAAGNASVVGEAKTIIGGAIIGLILALGSYIILNTINPSLVRFNILGLKVVSKETFSFTKPCLSQADCPSSQECKYDAIAKYNTCQDLLTIQGPDINPNCTSDANCESGQFCVQPDPARPGACLTGTVGDACVESSDCKAGLHCFKSSSSTPVDNCRGQENVDCNCKAGALGDPCLTVNDCTEMIRLYDGNPDPNPYYGATCFNNKCCRTGNAGPDCTALH